MILYKQLVSPKEKIGSFQQIDIGIKIYSLSLFLFQAQAHTCEYTYIINNVNIYLDK